MIASHNDREKKMVEEANTLTMTGDEWSTLYTILCDEYNMLKTIPEDMMDDSEVERIRDTSSILSKIENPDEGS